MTVNSQLTTPEATALQAVVVHFFRSSRWFAAGSVRCSYSSFLFLAAACPRVEVSSYPSGAIGQVLLSRPPRRTGNPS